MASNDETEPAGQGREPLEAHTLNEVRYYLMVSSCPLCDKGPQEIASAGPVQAGQMTTIQTRCKDCEQERPVEVICRHPAGAAPQTDLINPTDEPSRIVDLGQWLSLFYLLIESAATDKSKAGARRGGYQAMLCLAEALKFYGDNELPPKEAFFTDATRNIFRRLPEKFAKQRLRDMQAKLPAPTKMATRVAQDERRARRRWWQFWNR